MSRELLQHLNGANDGLFAEWLKQNPGTPRIAWYPSAGEDFRDLLYLSSRFTHEERDQREPAEPDLYLHTDYYPLSRSTFLDTRSLYDDERTKVSVLEIEELPRCDLPLDPEIVNSPEGSAATGRVVFFHAEVVSDKLGSYTVPVLYVFAENAAFCAQKMLPNNAMVSHIVHIRYGGGLGGGGKSSGVWLLNVLQKLGCRCFLTDNHLRRQRGDERVYELYPELSGKERAQDMQAIRISPSSSWSNHGDVTWNLTAW